MLRMSPQKSAKRAEDYYGQSDGGYYLDGTELRRRWGGKGAGRLGLEGHPEFEQFKRLMNGLDPHTGEQLTAKLIAGRLAAWDVTACVPKGVTIALEWGDERIHDKLWESVYEAMDMLEAYATTRVRVDGKQEDRRTGNLVFFMTEHGETRPLAENGMPDPDRHIHVVIANLTWDDVEQRWKAVKFRPIMDIRKYFDRCFDTILAGKLAELGYEIDTKWKADGRLHSWDIKGIPDAVIKKNSRRSAEIDAVEQTILKAMRKETGVAPERLNAVTRDKLGATSRVEKRDDLTRPECQEYWKGRLTGKETAGVADAINRARRGKNQRPPPGAEKAVTYAMGHEFHQRSVVPWEELATTAMEQSIGTASPDELLREFLRQGVIMRMKDGRLQCTTEALQREEDGIIGFAADGQGKVRPVGVDSGLGRTLRDGKVLNDGQWQAVSGLLDSPNRLNLLQGPAGAGKSYLLEKFDEGVRRAGQHVTYLATTATAVGVLEKDGFQANTLARFLLDKDMQAEAAGGRVVVDEVSMLGHADAVKLCEIAKKNDLKLIMVGDPMQHGSVPRGAIMRLLTEYGNVRPFLLREIMRQETPAYRAAAQLLSEGKTLEGFDALDRLGWVKELGDDQRYAAIAADYLQALNEKKSVLVVSPTHKESAVIADAIRATLRAAGKLGSDEREFTRLVQVGTSDAERGRVELYQPGDVLQFHQNAKGFTKGQRFTVTDLAKVPVAEAAKFSVYRPEKISLAAGDVIRFTGTVKTTDGQHTMKNGAVKTVAGFTARGDLKLDNGWVVGKDAGHFRSGFVETSFGSQGRTVQRVILGMAGASLAINQEQLYVSASRAKEWLRLYTDSKAEVRDGVQRSSQKLTALDLVGLPRKPKPEPSPLERMQKHLKRMRRRAAYKRTREGWERSGYGSPVRPSEPPRTPPRTPPTHRERVVEREGEKETGRGR